MGNGGQRELRRQSGPSQKALAGFKNALEQQYNNCGGFANICL
jgi:hypothetical protein